MKLFKKAREAFDRLRGKTTQAVETVKAAVEETVQVFAEPLPKYKQEQRDFERRAAARTVVHSGGTFNKGRNRDKRKGRVVMISRGASPRVAKRKQRDGIEFDAVAA